MRDLKPFDGSLPYFPDGPGHPRDLDGRGRAAAQRPVQQSPFAAGAALGTITGATTMTILFVWELGGGLGHLVQMLPLAAALARRDHRVFVALRDLDRAGPIFAGTGVRLLQAPIWLSGAAQFARPSTYSQMQANCGFRSEGTLLGRASAWLELMMLVQPDLIVFDHAPTALLASRALPRQPRRALIGSGFCSPPDDAAGERPWAIVRREEAAVIGFEKLRKTDAQVLARMNWMLVKWGQRPLERTGQLYSEVDDDFLTTFQELDHFPDRRGAGYWGPVLAKLPGGEPPTWPDAPGKRAFVYLKDPAATEAVLAALAEAKQPTVAFIDGASAEARQKLESPTMHIAMRPLDLRRVAAECDLAVLGGGHGATIEMLLAGLPVLEVPAAREQRMVADAVARLGAGEVALPKQPEQVREKLATMLSTDRYRTAAQAFARRYAAFDPRRQQEAMVARCEQLLSARRSHRLFA